MLVIPVTLAPIFVPQLHDVLTGVDEKRTRWKRGAMLERLEAALRLRSF